MVEKRSQFRIPVYRSCYVIHFDGRTEQGKVLNISDAGAGVHLFDPKSRGKKFQLAFRLPIGSKFEEILTNVVAVHCHLSGNVFHVGVMFQDMPESQKEIVKTYIANKKK